MPEGEHMPKRKKEEEQLERLYEQLAESVLSLSDSDLLSTESAQKDADCVSRLVQQATGDRSSHPSPNRKRWKISKV